MIGVIPILAGIAPGNVHFTCSQVDHQGVDRLLAVQWIGALNIMIANGIGDIDMILLDGLQTIDRMMFGLF
jgi:hypothetical protein